MARIELKKTIFFVLNSFYINYANISFEIHLQITLFTNNLWRNNSF